MAALNSYGTIGETQNMTLRLAQASPVEELMSWRNSRRLGDLHPERICHL
jgi:hypothetical protein